MTYANKIGEIAEFLEKAEHSLIVGDVIHAGLTSRAQDKEDARTKARGGWEARAQDKGTQGY